MMKLRYRDIEDVLEIFTEKQLIERNRILDKLNETGSINKAEATKFMTFERKTRLCGNCGAGVMNDEKKPFAVAKTDKGVEVGYHADCFTCEMTGFMGVREFPFL